MSKDGFGPTHVVEPKAGHAHTHTAVLLHGRGSTGAEFAEELFETLLSGASKASSGRPTLADALPSWRWVFPSSPSTWDATFAEWMPAWFEARSLADPTVRPDLQVPGLRAAVQHVAQTMDEEIQRLRGAHARLVLGGISLGGAVALWTLLSTPAPERPLGGLAVASTWLPFAGVVESLGGDELAGKERAGKEPAGKEPAGKEPAGKEPAELAVQTVQSLLGPLRQHLRQRAKEHTADAPSVLTTPVFVGHGRDDAYVDLALGQQARRVLAAVGFAVAWHEYEGAEQEGHWIKEPEEMDDLAAFLAAVASRSAQSGDESKSRDGIDPGTKRTFGRRPNSESAASVV